MLHTIWHIPEGFATLVAGFFVIVAAGIAWCSVVRQIRVTQEIEATKVRLDLYNRRFQIFVSIFDFYEALIAWKGTPEQRAAQTKFFRAYQESRFLFGKESGIEELLKKLYDSSGEVIGFKEHGEDYKAGGPQFYLERYNRMNYVLINEFDEALVKLRSALGDYMNFHSIDGTKRRHK